MFYQGLFRTGVLPVTNSPLNKQSKRRLKHEKGFITAAIYALAIPATAMATPSNEELHQMILENQKQITDAQTESAKQGSHIEFSKKQGHRSGNPQMADPRSRSAAG